MSDGSSEDEVQKIIARARANREALNRHKLDIGEYISNSL